MQDGVGTIHWYSTGYAWAFCVEEVTRADVAAALLLPEEVLEKHLHVPALATVCAVNGAGSTSDPPILTPVSVQQLVDAVRTVGTSLRSFVLTVAPDAEDVIDAKMARTVGGNAEAELLQLITKFGATQR